MGSLTKEEKQTLLQLARDTIELWVREKKRPPLPKMEGVLAEERGAFVTIHKRGQLRGCIGNIIGYQPLIRTIQEMAVAAAAEDPRFRSVTPEELAEIDIEISVLSPLEKIKDTNKIEVGKHGVVISQGWCKGLLLPQVAAEQGWDRDTFLTHTCYKAGLPADAWKDPETNIEIFSAEVFGELAKK